MYPTVFSDSLFYLPMETTVPHSEHKTIVPSRIAVKLINHIKAHSRSLSKWCIGLASTPQLKLFDSDRLICDHRLVFAHHPEEAQQVVDHLQREFGLMPGKIQAEGVVKWVYVYQVSRPQART